MSDLKKLITREIRAGRERIRGRMASDPVLKNFDPAGGLFLTPVADVDVGGDRLMRDVPIKINGPKARFYARLDAPVFLEKDAQGRYQVVAPADRVHAQGSLFEFDEDADTVTPDGDIGFTTVTQPYSFYVGTGIPGGGLYNDGVHGYPEHTNLDADGNEV